MNRREIEAGKLQDAKLHRHCANCQKAFSNRHKLGDVWNSALNGTPVAVALCIPCDSLARLLGSPAMLPAIDRLMRRFEAAWLRNVGGPQHG